MNGKNEPLNVGLGLYTAKWLAHALQSPICFKSGEILFLLKQGPEIDQRDAGVNRAANVASR